MNLLTQEAAVYIMIQLAVDAEILHRKECNPTSQENGSIRGYYESIYQDGAIGNYAFPDKGFFGFGGASDKF